MIRKLKTQIGVPAVCLVALAGCEGSNGFPSLTQAEPIGEAAVEGGATAATIVEKDVEAPDVFAVNEAGLWDGRPSLGGVWVAHPDVADPERVMIRNDANGKFVVGALFRRERDIPGPRIQVSSDAAEELGMLAGQPTVLDVIALRRETVEIPAAIGETTNLADATGAEASIEADTLDPVATAAAAIEAASAAAPATEIETAAATPAAAPAPAPASSLDKPYIQIGIFSVKQNADNTAASLRNIGVIPTVRAQEASGKPFWRVIVGPATNLNERRIILGKVRNLGFEDAYYVTN